MKIHKPLSGLLVLLVLALSLLVPVSPVMAYADDSEPVPEATEPEPGSETEPVTGGAEPLTPEGNVALVDNIHSESDTDKQFIVVQSRSGHYFYIIIDNADEGENIVHFLNQVDEADLLALIDEEEKAPAVCSCTTKCVAGAVNTFCEVCAVNMAGCVGPESTPKPVETETPDEQEPPKEPEKKSGGDPLMIVLVLAVLGAGGAVAYLKLFKNKPKTRGSADLDDYDYGDDDQDESDEYEDDEYEPDDDSDDELEDE